MATASEIEIERGDPCGLEAVVLIRALDRYLGGLYPAQENYLEPPEKLVGATFLVARHNGEAVGCVAVKDITAGRGEIKRLYVQPEARGLGLARCLMAEAEACARQAGIAVLLLETGAKQIAACRFYETIGYRYRGLFGEYRDNGASLFMEKQL